MPASKDPGPQDQKTQKRKEWSTPRLRLLGNHKPETPPILSRSVRGLPQQPTGQITENSGARLSVTWRRYSAAAAPWRPLP